MISAHLILLSSILAQLFSAFLALRLIKTTRHFWVWIALAGAITLMALRRIVSYYELIQTGNPASINMTSEAIALVISLLMLVAIIRIRPILQTLYSAVHDLEQANSWLKQEIVQRRKAEARAAANEEKFRKLAHYSPILIWMSDVDGRVSYFNENWLVFRGRGIEQEKGMGWTDGLHPDDKAGVVDRYLAAVGKRTSFELEYRLMHHSGQYRWIYDKGAPMYDHHKRFLGYIGSCIDITKRKESEKRLARSEEQKSLILHAMQEKLIFLDPDMKIQWTNRAVQEISGMREQQMVGKPCYEVYHQFHEPCRNCPSIRALNSGQEEHSEVWFYDRLYLLRAYPLMDHGSIKGILEVGEDITERRKTEELLKQSERKFRMFFDENNAVKLIINPETGRIKSANKSAKAYYGYQDLESKYIQQINQLPDEQVKHEMQQAYYNNKNLFYFNHELASGEIRDVEVHSTTLEIDQTKYLYSIIHDITDRRKAEEALRESENKFKKIVNSLPQFVSYVDRDEIYRYVNQTYLNWFGLQEQQIVGHHLAQVIGQKSYEQSLPYIRRVFNGEQVNYHEHFHYPSDLEAHMDGTLIPQFDQQGRVEGYYAILSDITPYVENQRLLEDSRNRLRVLSAYQQNLLEKERSYIAREIHDELGQNLTAIRMGLSMLKKQVQGQQPKLSAKTEEINQITEDTITQIKKLSTELRPRLIDDMGLVAAIEWYTNHFEKRSNIYCHLEMPEDDVEFSKNMAIHLYRILQEALTNVYKHAEASRVDLLLEQRSQQVHFRIQDNGIGLEKNDQNKNNSLGIMGIEERVRLMNGDLKINGQNGTTLDIWIPYGENKPAQAESEKE